MLQVMVRHRVVNYNLWRLAFDDHEYDRKDYGEQSALVFRSSADPQDVLMLFTWDNEENARRFMASDNLREAMSEAGVIGKPEFHVFNGVT